MPKQKLKNVLPNTYQPVIPKKAIGAALSRLQKQSIVALILLWPRLKHTQPHIDKENSPVSHSDFCKQARQEALAIRENPGKWTKAKLIDIILHQYWGQGLNLLQLAQIDCQLIVDNPNSFFWLLSTVKDADGVQTPMVLHPPDFLNRLAHALTKIFMSHIYVCTHPRYPLILIRIQVFDLSPQSLKLLVTSAKKNPHIISHRPYFLAIPMNSPHLIHSPSTDLVSEIVLNVVEHSLSKSPRKQLRVETPESQKPIRSLDSIFILKGCSRFANSMGSWAPYADGDADLSPLATPESHVSHTEKTKFLGVHKETDPRERLREISNIRFKGKPDGVISSEKLFDDQQLSKRRKLVPEKPHSPYASIAPIKHAHYVLKENIGDEESSISMRLVGNDVFAGLHELAANIDSLVVDPEMIPGWLTGEEGASCGIVKNGHFTAHQS